LRPSLDYLPEWQEKATARIGGAIGVLRPKYLSAWLELKERGNLPRR
jgi:hypothetical protein